MEQGLVIEFDSPKVVSRVPESVITSDKIVITEMIDSPIHKKVTVYTLGAPGRIVLWEGAAYDAIGNWTNQDVIDRINEICE
jgi:hypothetical protein